MKFTGAVLVNTNHPLQLIENIQVPRLKAGQVLVKVAYAGVCHSQLMEQSGKRGIDKYLPHLLGHEGTGTVIETGSEVSKVKAGDKVVLGWLKGEGMDVGGSTYKSPIGTINSGAVTTFSEITVVSENRCYTLPDNISMQEGVLLGCALPTGMGIVKNQVKPTSTSTIGIIGLGGIGMSALIAATCLPHQSLIAIDTNEEKLAIAKTLGADYCINPAKQNLATEIQELTSGKMLDFAVEAAGSCKTIELGFSIVNKQTGQCIFASHPPAGEKIQLDPFELICGKTITGSWGGCSHPEHMATFVSESKTQMNLSPFMSDFYRLKDINMALDDLKQQNILRAIVEVNPN